MTPLDRLGIRLPLIQAPMAGVSTPALAAAVSNAGALGSLGLGNLDATAARTMIEATRALTGNPFNVNLFVHRPARPDAAREAAWLAALRPLFQQYDAEPPAALHEIYTSFAEDDAMLAMLLATAPRVVSFHFGLPDSTIITALKQAGCLLLATATNLTEARAAEAAGIDMLVAQGWEAGGHRGMFDVAATDEQLDTFTLTRQLARHSTLPVIAAGGIMDGRGIRAALDAGAIAAQLGTAFVSCPESSADVAYREALRHADHTLMTSAISGRPARCLANKFTQWGMGDIPPHPDYPIAYDAGKALNAAAKAAGESGYGAQWAGTHAHASRFLPAAALVAQLMQEAAA